MEIGFSRRCWLAGFACSVTALGLMSHYLRWTVRGMDRLVLLAGVIMLAATAALWFFWKEKREKRFAIGFGVLFALSQLCGERVLGIGTIAQTGVELLELLALALALAPCAGGVFCALANALGRARSRVARMQPARLGEKTVFWGSTLILLLCWLPYLLAYYPGLFTYDISWQYQQFLQWNLNTHHPLIHTLLVGGLCELGWQWFGYPVKGFLMYTVLQMILMALAMASAVRLLHRCRAPLWTRILMLAAYALLPFHALMAISSTKDTLFAGAVLYLSVLLMEAVLDSNTFRKPGWMIRFVLAEAAVGLFRNNGFICIAAVAFLGVIGLVRYRRAAVRLLALSLCGMMVYLSVNAGLKAATNAEDGHIREMLSVPLQQLARVYCLTEDEAKPEIEKWLPDAAQYSPPLADMVKNTFDAKKEDLPRLFSLWAQVGLRHPIVYVDSFLVTGAGFYHIDAPPTGQYAETSFHQDEGWWMVPDSKWPWLRDLTTRLYSRNEFLDIPLYSIVLSPALWAWIMLFSLWMGLCRQNRAVVAAGFVLFSLYLTLLLSPCVMMRYVYPIMLCAPLLLSALISPAFALKRGA